MALGWWRRTDTRQNLPQKGASSATGEPPSDTYHKGTATAGHMEDCPSTTSVKDFEKIVDDIITWSYTLEGGFSRGYAAFSPTTTRMAWF
jgi:hypothetical protein